MKNIIYALLADYSGATYPTREARIEFAAGIDLSANTLQMIFQLVLTRPLMVRFGPAAAMATNSGLPIMPSLFRFLIFVGLLGGLAYSTRSSTRLPVPRLCGSRPSDTRPSELVWR